MKFDHIVIGTGPAGSIVSNELAKKGLKVALIDRANNEKPKIINDFFAPYIEKSPKYYNPVFSNTLGGNSILWHSKVYLLSKSEMESYKWPISYHEIKRNSDQLAKQFNLKKELLTKEKTLRGKLYRYSHRAQFRNLYEFLKIGENKNISVFKGFSPIKMNINNKNIKSLIIRNIYNEEKKIIVKNDIVFCCGGLGNPHILLNLLGKFNNNLGKFLSDHSHINLGKIKDIEIEKFKKIIKPNIKLHIGDKEDEAALVIKDKKYFCGVQLDYKIDPAKQLIRFFIRIKSLKIRLILNLFSFMIRKINGAFFMMGIIFKKYYKYSFEFFFSQNPNSKNKIFLSNTTDKFGLRKININWNLKKNDFISYVRLIKKISKNENVKIKHKDLLKSFYKDVLVGQHPSCTTKIGKNRNDGVVDKNLKMFGFNNIYIVGSSVFPSNGYTNPTWTIMTLAFRLAKKLIKNQK